MKKIKILMSVILILVLLPAQSVVFAADGDVAQIGDEYFVTLEGAVEYANSAQEAVTIQIIDDISLTSDITITSEVSIINGTGGEHEITLDSASIIVSGSGNLTLGSSNANEPLLSIKCNTHVIKVTDGTLEINDGILLESTGGHAVNLDGENVTANVTGGRLTGFSGALTVNGGATVSNISGGYFGGGGSGTLGVYTGGKIESITGCVINSNQTGIYVDEYSSVNEISGGTIKGANRGIENRSYIGSISGNVEISTESSNYGLLNGGHIEIISGGTFSAINEYGRGLSNTNKIGSITGGVFLGGYHGFTNWGNGSIDSISGGVFLGIIGSAIETYTSFLLEPGLNGDTGNARFWGNNGLIFNNEALIEYPINSLTGATYQMSSDTVAVDGIDGYSFKYLMLPTWDLKFDANIPEGANGEMVTVPTSASISSESGSEVLSSPDGVPTSTLGTYRFINWNTSANGSGISYETGSVVPAQQNGTLITLYAQWEFTPYENGTDNQNDGSGGSEDSSSSPNNFTTFSYGNQNGVSAKSNDNINVLGLLIALAASVLTVLGIFAYHRKWFSKVGATE